MSFVPQRSGTLRKSRTARKPIRLLDLREETDFPARDFRKNVAGPVASGERFAM
jgi:hypothetical protein